MKCMIIISAKIGYVNQTFMKYIHFIVNYNMSMNDGNKSHNYFYVNIDLVAMYLICSIQKSSTGLSAILNS